MTESERPPRSPERAEGDPAGEEPDAGRTPHPDQPAEGPAGDDGPADTPSS